MKTCRREFIKTAGIVAAEAAFNFPFSRAIMPNAKVQEPVYSNMQELAKGRKLIGVGSCSYEYSSGGILHFQFQDYRITNNAMVLFDREKPLGVLASITNSHWFNRADPRISPHILFSRLASGYPLRKAEELSDPGYRESMIALHIKNKDSTLIPDSRIEGMFHTMGFRDMGKIYLDARETRQQDIALDVDNRKLHIFSDNRSVMMVDFS